MPGNDGITFRTSFDSPVVHQIAMGAIVLGVSAGSILYSGETALGALSLLCLAVVGGIAAYQYPTATLVVWGVLSLYWRQMLDAMSVAGGVDARPTDPILLAMAIALLFALVQGDRRIKETLAGPCLVWAAFLGWIALQVILSIPKNGLVSTLGEFRWTFQPLLVIPYIVVFVRTEAQQRRLFKSLLLLSILFVAVAIFWGLFVHAGVGSKATRWMVAHVNLALVFATAAWYTSRRTGFWFGGTNLYVPLIFTTLALVVFVAHRSVWAATAATLFGLTCLGLTTGKDIVKLGGALLVAGIGIDILASDLDLVEFIRERTTAFTSYTQDPTANWRAQVWTVAMEQIRSYPISGKGLGNYFYLQLDAARVVTTIPHNVYIQIALQVGLIGLVLYLVMVAHMFRLLFAAYRRSQDVHTYTLTAFAMVVLFGGSIFYFAYGFEPFTWLFVGAGMAAALSQSSQLSRG